MSDVGHDDPAMTRTRDWIEKSGLTLHELGVKMGYDAATARNSVWQFLKSKDPRISMLRKFADAAGIPIEELILESPKKKRANPKG